MKVTVTGFDWMEGDSKKTGRPYSIGKFYVQLPIDGKNAKGTMGAEYDTTAELVRRFEVYPVPFEAQLVIQDVVRFGKRESKLVDVVPLARADLKAPDRPQAPSKLPAAA